MRPAEWMWFAADIDRVTVTCRSIAKHMRTGWSPTRSPWHCSAATLTAGPAAPRFCILITAHKLDWAFGHRPRNAGLLASMGTVGDSTVRLFFVARVRCDPCLRLALRCLGVDLSAGSSDTSEVAHPGGQRPYRSLIAAGPITILSARPGCTVTTQPRQDTQSVVEHSSFTAPAHRRWRGYPIPDRLTRPPQPTSRIESPPRSGGKLMSALGPRIGWSIDRRMERTQGG